MNCCRCNKEINSPDCNNSDYIIADDFIINEEREIYDFTIEEEDENTHEKNEKIIRSQEFNDAKKLQNIKKIEVKNELVPIQKTGIICPDCYKETDLIIWGVHKK